MKKNIFILFAIMIASATAAGLSDNCINHKGCLSMATFSNTYREMLSAMDTLNTKVKYLKSDLDTAINQTCGQDYLKSTVSHPYNLTFCDFENGMCSYVKDTQYSYGFRLLNTVDHTYGTLKGHVVQVYTAYSSGMLSFPFDKASTYCIRFFYKTSARLLTGSLKVYIKENNGVGIPIFSLTEFQHYWQLAEITPDPEFLRGTFEIVFAGVKSDGLMLDDIGVYNVPCSTNGIRKPSCTDGKEWQNGTETSCITFHIEPATWYDAIKRCKRDWPYAHLVSVTSASKQNFLMNKIISDQGLTQTAAFGYWTSGNDETSEGHWIWTGNGTPTPLNYTDWHAGQPNNVGGNQDCLLIQYYNDHYKWGDVGCTEEHPFICEAKYQHMNGVNGANFIGK